MIVLIVMMHVPDTTKTKLRSFFCIIYYHLFKNFGKALELVKSNTSI